MSEPKMRRKSQPKVAGQPQNASRDCVEFGSQPSEPRSRAAPPISIVAPESVPLPKRSIIGRANTEPHAYDTAAQAMATRPTKDQTLDPSSALIDGANRMQSPAIPSAIAMALIQFQRSCPK